MLAMQLRMPQLDLVIMIGYLATIVSVGCLVGFLRRRQAREGREYFLAGGRLTWPIIGLALFSTNISTIHLVAQAEEGFLNGLAYGNFEWMAPFTLIALSLFFAPFYIRSKVATLPDFLERRYNSACRNWLALLSIIAAVFIHIGFTLYTGAVVLQGLFGIPKMYSIVGVSVLTGLYTAIGGLMAVVITESIETIVLLLGAICIAAIGYDKIGGWEGISQHVEPVKLTMLRNADDSSNLPWYSVFLGYPIIGLWYWCADQTIVQRVLGAKNENHARVGPLFAGFIKILPVFIFILPGTICLALLNRGDIEPLPVQRNVEAGATQDLLERPLSETEQKVYELIKARSLKKDKAASADYLVGQTGLEKESVYGAMAQLVDRGLVKSRSEDVYAHMITHLLPTGLRGVVAAALLAALMGTMSGAMNSIATLFSYDIYKQLRPNASDRSLIRVGRVATVVCVFVAILWSPAIARFDSIYQGCNSLICYIAPPITAVFVWGVMWRRASSAGALTTLLVGSLLGAVVFFADWFQDITGWSVPFMMATFYLFVICSVVLVAVSLWKPDPVAVTAERKSLSWRNPLGALKGKAWPGPGSFRFLAVVLFGVMVDLYVLFGTTRSAIEVPRAVTEAIGLFIEALGPFVGGMAILLGALIGVGIYGLLGAILLRVGARFVSGMVVDFPKAFWISIVFMVWNNLVGIPIAVFFGLTGTLGLGGITFPVIVFLIATIVVGTMLKVGFGRGLLITLVMLLLLASMGVIAAVATLAVAVGG